MSARFCSAIFFAALLLAACSGGSGHASPTTTVVTPKGEHASQAAATGTLLPLADLPAGTTSQTLAKPSNVSCTGKPFVTKPRYLAGASYQLPRGSTRLGDLVNIYAPGGAAHTMRNVREQWNCQAATDLDHPDRQWSIAKLNFPLIAPGQLTYRLQHSFAVQPNVTTSITDDLLVVPVNSSSVLELSASATSPNGSGVVDLSAFEDFARKAWARAESTLGR